MSRISQHPTERDRYGLNMALAAFSRRENLYPGATELVKCLLSQIDNDHAAKEPTYDALRAEAEALRAEDWRKQQTIDGMNAEHWKLVQAHAAQTKDLESARGLLRHASSVFGSQGWDALTHEIDTFLTATQAPEVPDHIESVLTMVDQGDRQEAVAEPDWHQDISMGALEWMESLGSFGPTVLADRREIKGYTADKDGDLVKTYYDSSELRGLAGACAEVADWLDKRAIEAKE